jgi:peptidoglycan/LPS O-acetylase OafA/YrhL
MARGVVLAGVRGATWAAVAAVCIVPLIRVLFFMHDQSNLSKVGITFETTADVLAMGCLLALFRARDRALELPAWLAPLLIVAGIACNVRWRLGLLIGRSLLALGIAVGIDRCVRHPTSWFGRILNARPFVFVGEISYSLYLWQQVVLNRSSPTSRFPLNLALAGLLALMSYYAIEQPARMRIRPAAERWLAQWREHRSDQGEVVTLG